MFNEYDQHFVTTINNLNDNNTLVNAIDFFDIQRLMLIELIYKITEYMTSNNIAEFPLNKAFNFMFGIHTEEGFQPNNFILNYDNWISAIFENDAEYSIALTKLYCTLEFVDDLINKITLDICDEDICLSFFNANYGFSIQ
jgi:hypothetical protein